jgi:hypothetical protein
MVTTQWHPRGTAGDVVLHSSRDLHSPTHLSLRRPFFGRFSPMRSDVPDTPVYLIGFAESWATPEVCFSLHASGARIVCFCRRNARAKFARLKFVEYYPVTAPESDLSHAVDDVEALIARFQPEAIIPCEDAALLVLAKLNCSDKRCLVPPAEACQFAMDKWAQIDAARASGFAVIPTELVESEADVARFPIRPAMLKPRNALDVCGAAVGKGRSFVVEGDDLSGEAREALSQRAYLIQEYKVGVGEGVFGIAHGGKVCAGFGHRRLRMVNPAGSGSSACVSRLPDAGELQAAETLVRRVAWQGPFMVELLRDFSGRTWFMEFNGRFWGSLALARRCGLDMPRLACELARGQDPEMPSQIEPGFARHLGRDLIHLLFVLRGPRGDARAHRWPGRISTLKAIFSLHPLSSFYNYDRSQPFFFVKDAAITVTNQLMRRKN